MNDLERRIAELSPQKRELLLQKLKGVTPAVTRPRTMARQPRTTNHFPLSFAQQRLWFLDQLVPDNSFYAMPTTVRLVGTLNVAALEQSIAEVVRRHEALRTTFSDVEGQGRQIIQPAGDFVLSQIDLTGFPEAERETEAARLLQQEAKQPFDLTKGPVFLGKLVKINSTHHLLMLKMHHIVSDGWSLDILVREVGALYSAFSTGKPSPLPELPLQYADFSVWQREWLSGEVLENQLQYWRQKLENVSVLELPTDRPRPLVQQFRGAKQTFLIPPVLVAALKDLCQEEGVTPFVALLAVFKTCLHRAARQIDISVGTPIANRNRLETEGLIGFFANTLVLRTDLGGNPTFRSLLKRVNETALGAYSHQDLPFEKLVEELRPGRDLSRTPLFQVMFVLYNNPESQIRTPELALEPVVLENSIAKFDLTLSLLETEEGFLGGLEFNTDLYDAATMTRMAGHFQTLLAAAVARPDTRLADLPWLTEAEYQTVVNDWNQTEIGFRVETCLHTLFEEQVTKNPGAVALSLAGRTITYQELNHEANQLAHYLQKLGVGPETLVGICVERSVEMVTGLLAVVKAGGALVALDTAYPKDRLALMMSEARVRVLLTQERLRGLLPEQTVQVLCLDNLAELVAGESGTNPASGVTVDNLLYAIFTSGSTGLPKGIGISHRAFGNLLAWQYRHPRLQRGARTVQYSTFGFCVSFQEIFSTLCTGEVLVILPEDIRRDIASLGQFLKENAVERLHLPFAALKNLAENASHETLPATLRDVITAGEQLQVTESVRRLFERLPDCALHNQYGASETHVVSALTLTPPHEDWPAIPSVGHQIANTRMYLLDDSLRPVPIGIPGEVYVGGVCLARGYLNDAALTAEKFLPDPFGTTPGGRLYKTGDLARWLADGQIEYFGRADNQVKIRGFRIELGDIETTLVKHPDVRDAAVLARSNAQGLKFLVGYVVWDKKSGESGESGESRESEDPTARFKPQTSNLKLQNYSVDSQDPQDPQDSQDFRGLTRFLKEQLPDYMVPSMWVEMDRLPVNANGKLDQTALPTPEFSRPRLAEHFVAPTTSEEKKLAAIWSEVLGLEQVGIHDNFFELGGHSLLATQVFSRLRDTFQVRLPLRVLFENPTIAELVNVLIQAQTAAPAPTRPVMRAVAREAYRREAKTLDVVPENRSTHTIGG
ncbi:MAG: amino acid adenylation domain-containing protein [Blastocatellia bacterium]|nr:amino acid adenylation domain-containing protein [Blastocatellia bacterium]